MILCTQEKIRDVNELILYTKMYINKEYLPLPSLLKMNDDLYIYDGHTRFISFLLYIKYIYSKEDVFNNLLNETKNEILETQAFLYARKCHIFKVDESYTKTPSIKSGFVTPFDLEKEVRVCDFYSIKNYIIKHIEDTGDLSIIDRTSHLYKKPRSIKSITELASNYDFILERL